MKKNFLLIMCALLLLCGCKKDKMVPAVRLHTETPRITTTTNTAAVEGSYIYAGTPKLVVIAYGKDSSLSSPQKVTAEHTCDSYSVTINNLESGTTYYFHCIFDTGYGTAESEQWSFTTQSGGTIVMPLVTTSSVTNITQTSVACGGNVTSNGGATVTARGVCWSTSQNPTVSNSHTTDGSGTGSFTSSITGLTASTTYYVRAYATNSAGTSYGEQKSFMTQSGGGGGVIAGHEYVDLGLPSGTLWATCNIGASSPEDYGNYYAWGETTTKNKYNWSTYKWCNGSENTLTKYCTDSSYGIVDNKTVLEPADDAAHVNWGGSWRMPTHDEMKELKDNCAWTWTTQNNVNGYRVTGPNGKSIFLPAAGYCDEMNLISVGSYGDYWSSLLIVTAQDHASDLYFRRSYVYSGLMYRYYGISVRPVSAPQN